MTLGFSTKINNEYTFFVEKIIAGFKGFNNYNEILELNGYGIDNFIDNNFTPKIHTIRNDYSNRWKKGNKIHFVINNRTPKRFQFMPVIKCVSTQEVWIQPYSKRVLVYNEPTSCWRELKLEDIETLSKNDGFKTVGDFWNYFNSEFAGKIIHWTDFRY